MKSSWTRSLSHQFLSAGVRLAAREVMAWHVRTCEAPSAHGQAEPWRRTTSRSPRKDALATIAFLAVIHALGYAALRWIWSVVWWLATGHGAGGRRLAAGAVTPRDYDFRDMAGRPR